MRIATAEEALVIINAHNALGKNVETINPSAERPFNDPVNHVAFLLRQLRDPQNVRPVRDLPSNIDRTRIYNSTSNTWEMRSILGERGRPKETEFTKKTPTSLVSPRANIEFYAVMHGIIFILDLTKSKIKPEHIYAENIVSRDKPWLHGGSSQIRPPVPTTIEKIRKKQMDHKGPKLLPWSEILAGLSKDALIAIAPAHNDLTRRLNAYYQTLIIQIELNIQLPVLIEEKNKAFYEYTSEMLKKDLAKAKTPIQKEFADQVAFLLKNPTERTESSARCLLDEEQARDFAELQTELTASIALIKIDECVIPDEAAFIHELTHFLPSPNTSNLPLTEQSSLTQPLTNQPAKELRTLDELRQYHGENKAKFKEMKKEYFFLVPEGWRKFASFVNIGNPAHELSKLPSNLSEKAFLGAFYLAYQNKTIRWWPLIVSCLLFVGSIGLWTGYAIVAKVPDPSCDDGLDLCSTSSEESALQDEQIKILFRLFGILCSLLMWVPPSVAFITNRESTKKEEESARELLAPMVRFFQRRVEQAEPTPARETTSQRDTFVLNVST